MPRGKKLTEREQAQIRRLYHDHGLSGPAIAKQLGLNKATVYRYLGTLVNRKRPRKYPLYYPIKAQQLYEQGGLVGREIADRLGVPLHTVYSWLYSAGAHTHRNNSSVKATHEKLQRARDFEHDYAEGDSTATIAARHGVSRSTVVYWLRKLGHDTGKRARGNDGG